MENQGHILPLLQVIFDSSDSDDSDDEDLLMIDELLNGENNRLGIDRAIPRVRNFIQDIVYNYSDEEFRQNFRVRRTTFYYILTLVRPDLEGGVERVGRYPIPAEDQLLIALWVLGTPDSYRSVTAKFGCALATAWYAVRRVVHALCRRKDEFIRWPTEEEARQTSNFIEMNYGFPGAIGAIDGTHIRISAPRNDRQSYINRKNVYSIQLQAVCNERLQFLHCFTGMPGSVHDMRVFSYSGMQQRCNDNFFPDNSHILGDAAYTLQNHIMVPYRNNGQLTIEQEHLNYVLSSSRMIIERAWILLKGRWRYLIEKLPMTQTRLISFYILACCVLHNICILLDDELEYPLPVPDNDIDEGRDGNNGVQPMAVDNLMQQQGVQKRENILRMLS